MPTPLLEPTPTLCSFAKCGAATKAVGLCGAHWLQQRNGQELRPVRRYANKVERIMAHVVKNEDTGCWEWQGCKNAAGYGYMGRGDGGTSLVHRRLYQLVKGELPQELTIDHLCRVRHCVNPDHMEPVDFATNSSRQVSFNGTKTHCRNGHEFTAENTIHRGPERKHRKCRTRQRKRQAEWEARQK